MSIKNVSFERWAKAQEWELKNWQDHQKRAFIKKLIFPIARPILRMMGSRKGEWDDWNYWWETHFNSYNFLPTNIDNYIELGCGPYTNTRVIAKKHNMKHIVCSDPLIKQYAKFKYGWIKQQYNKCSIMIDDHPIEECPFAIGYFDVVVMINVLDHVKDANICIKNAINITKPGGYLIIGQELTNDEDLNNMKSDPCATGHPITLDKKDIEGYLTGFSIVLKKYLERQEGRNPKNHYSTLIFAGRKID